MSELKRKKTRSQGDERRLATASIGVGKEIDIKSSGANADILPPELLELIFKNVESPEDLLSCWNTCSTWAAALRSTEFYLKMTLPFVLPYLNLRDILNWSTLSKSWNATVDACIQTAEDFGSDSRPTGKQLIVQRLETEYGKLAYFNRFTMPWKIPFVSLVAFRRIYAHLWSKEPRGIFDEHIYDDEDRMYADKSDLLEYLDRYGHLIHYFHLDLSEGDNVSCFNKLEVIRSCLKRTPNLRVLSLDPAASYNSESKDFYYIDELETDLETFREYNSKKPWPALEHLKILMFDLNTNRKEVSSIVHAYAPQLVYLRFGFGLLEPLWTVTGRFLRLQKITYIINDSCSGEDLEAFLQSSNCPLKEIKVIICSPVHVNASNMNGLITAVNTTSGTLETFSLVHLSYERVDFEIVKLDRLRLPKLNVLNLNCCGYPSLEFLHSVCPALQQLTVVPSHVFCRDWELTETAEAYYDLYSQHQHQFWNQLADIRRVTVDLMDCSKRKTAGGGWEQKVYTRSRYEAKLEEDRALGVKTQVDEQTVSVNN